MATSSTVGAFKAQLVSSLATAIGDPAVLVAYGRPQDHLVRREGVFVADVAYTSTVANMRAGRAHYDEDYTVDVVFAAAKPRGEASEAETRVFALFEFLRDVLADESGKQGLGVDGVWSATVANVDAAVDHQGEGPVAVLVASVRVRARVE